MKKYIKYLFLVIMLAAYYLIEPVSNIFNYEINFISTTRFLAKSLYDEDITVSSNPLIVKDYCVVEDRLYIFPLDNTISLPIDVMVVESGLDTIEVVNFNERYTISNFTKKNARLYEYVYSLNEIAFTDDFFVVDGSNLEPIISRLTIYYEKV